MVDIAGTRDRLHVQRWHSGSSQMPVLMIHGSIENGRIFYSSTGKGLSPFLADRGWDVFVPDLRGRGRSTPTIARGGGSSQHQAIVKDLPLLAEYVSEKSGHQPQTWVAHSWGGVIMLSSLVRFAELRQKVRAIVLFGTKRAIAVRNLDKLLQYHLFWEWLGTALVSWLGYLPAKRLHMGADDEPAGFHKETCQWANPKNAWVDPTDGFDYFEAAQRCTLPPSFWLAGPRDTFLGHVSDVRRFREETQQNNSEELLLSKDNGFSRDYGHIDMLTHSRAMQDHFPVVERWMNEAVGASQ